jgi:hypothetical protein
MGAPLRLPLDANKLRRGIGAAGEKWVVFYFFYFVILAGPNVPKVRSNAGDRT